MSKQEGHFYEFGPFRLDTSERLLLRADVRVPLTEKAFDTLVALVRREGRLVSKEELIAEVWPDAFVEENNLDKSISAIRQALGEKPSAPEYVETVRGRGYRFVARVSEGGGLAVKDQSTAPVSMLDDSGAMPTASQTAKRLVGSRLFRSPLLISIAGLLALGLGVAIYSSLSGRAKRAESAAAPRVIAVLPFKPLASDARDESLELGMADTLITKLGALRAVTVRPLSAVRRYSSLEQDPVAAGRELGVEAVLDGSIQHAGDRIRVTVRLMRVADGVSLWTGTYDKELADIFAVQDIISEQVTHSLAVRLSGEEERQLGKRYTNNTEAYQIYSRGRYFWNKRTEEAIRKSIDYFEQAIALDPDYALAYSGLADAYWILSSFDPAGGVTLLPQSRTAALKALALDDTLAEAHTSLGIAKEFYELDFTAAEREYRRAIELNQNYASAHHRYGFFLNRMERIEEAHNELRRALELDPLSLPINVDAARPFFRSGDYERAIGQLQKAIEIDPNYPRAHNVLANWYAQMGRYDDAIAEAKKAAALSAPAQQEGGPPRGSYQLVYIYAKAGRASEARRLLDELERRANRRNDQLYFQALAHAALGDRERAFALMEELYKTRSLDLLGLKGDPAWDDLRGDPRFRDLLQRFGFAP
jgi:DNA-binding winged helix-turn-helix (wHTH) protein/TolB-like protein/Tfp pilus assembly protein PilF